MRMACVLTGGCLLVACAGEPVATPSPGSGLELGASVAHAWAQVGPDPYERDPNAPHVSNGSGEAYALTGSFAALATRVQLRAQYAVTEHHLLAYDTAFTLQQFDVLALLEPCLLGGERLSMHLLFGVGGGQMIVDGDRPLPFEFHRALHGGIALGAEVKVLRQAVLEVLGTAMQTGDMGDSEGFTTMLTVGGGFRF